MVQAMVRPVMILNSTEWQVEEQRMVGESLIFGRVEVGYQARQHTAADVE